MDEYFKIEARLAAEGINPMFGEWRQKFNMEPVSYSNKGAAKLAFKQTIREHLHNKFVFVGQVQVTITLYLEEEKMLETPAYGDLDNYAKQLLDSLKGKGRLIIDDCQVQRLDISWIDVPHSPRFEVEFKSSPDDFLPEPLTLYEMPDGLYYPLSTQAWTQEGLIELRPSQQRKLTETLAHTTRTSKNLRHTLRQGGVPQFRTFQTGKYVSPILMGFHHSRIVDSGYDIKRRSSWEQE